MPGVTRDFVLERLPGDVHAYTRWLYACIIDLCGEAGTYTGPIGYVRSFAGLGTGPTGAPRTLDMLAQLAEVKLLNYTYNETEEKGRQVTIQLLVTEDEMCA
jgi:hypothetical protein